MRKSGVLRFDRADYERLSRESLWSVTEALNVAANIEMDKSKGFQEEFWVEELNETFARYGQLAYQWCVDKKLFPLGCEGRSGDPLPEEKWKAEYVLLDDNDQLIEQVWKLNRECVYFHKDGFLSCLKESGVAVGDDLWAEVSPKPGEANLSSNQQTRLVCQGMAIALWDLNPEMTIAKMADQKVMREKGRGQAFTAKTRREWVSEVDPRPKSKKTGPKPK